MISAVIGLQYGDEGKGRYLDYLLKDYDVTIRFNGSSNAGHQCVINDKNYAVHLVPTGVFRGKESLIGNECVLDPISFCNEIKYLNNNGFDTKCVCIGSRVSLICPFHKYIDKYFEQTNSIKLGTTKQGVGPAYADKMRRIALRMQDSWISKNQIFDKYKMCLEINKHQMYKQDYEKSINDFEQFYSCLLSLKYMVCDVTHKFVQFIESNKNILFEGAQSTQLDLTWGEYPYVTSSSCIVQNAMLSVGYRFNFDHVYGVFKAYTTRVGTGPFITIMDEETQLKTRQKGHQYGTTTGRPRVCGWLDLVSLKRSCIINGVTDLCMVKSDVLDNYENVKLCVQYQDKSGDKFKSYPFTSQFKDVAPIYVTFDGWNNYFDEKLNKFINFIQDYTCVKIKYLSYSPKREDVVVR